MKEFVLGEGVADVPLTISLLDVGIRLGILHFYYIIRYHIIGDARIVHFHNIPIPYNELPLVRYLWAIRQRTPVVNLF